MTETTLVTGGNGFIGRHLVDLLHGRGERVRVLDARAAADLPEGVEFIQGSILDREILDTAFRGVGRLYHLAANPDLWARDKRDFDRVNHLGTRMVLDAAERAGVARVIYTSTESILKSRRHRNNGAKIDEGAQLTVDDMPGPYCRSKFLAEQEALAAAARGLPLVVVNPTLPVGPGDGRLTPPTQMLIGFLNGDNPAYLDFSLNLIDVRDAARGHILAAEKGRVGERYILGGENLRLSELLDILHELTGQPMPSRCVPYPLALAAAALSEFAADFITRRPPVAPLTGVRLAGSPFVFDCRKASDELGLPRSQVRDALADAIVWLSQQGLIECGLRTGAAAASVRAPSAHMHQAILNR